MIRLLVATFAALSLGACGGPPSPKLVDGNEPNAMDGAEIVDVPADEGNADESGNMAEPDAAPESASAKSWVGHWIGVEGLVLDIAADPQVGAGHYQLTMQYGLDAGDHGTFPGVEEGGAIRFHRPDGDQVMRHGDGDATGLKYLAGKQDCVVVKPGEGYCRD